MAFDAFFLSAVLTEIREKTPGGRVEKIHQPSRDTVILHLKSPEGRYKLLFGMNPTAPQPGESPGAAYVLYAFAQAPIRRKACKYRPDSYGALGRIYL